MTEDKNAAGDEPAPPSEPPPATGQRLERGREGRILTGVCAGLGRYTRIDPVVFRVGFALLVLATGIGVLLYIAAFLLMPGENDDESLAEQLFKRRLDGDTALALLGAVFAAGVLLNLAGSGLSGEPGDALIVVTLLTLTLLVAHSRGVDIIQLARSIPDRLQGRLPTTASTASTASGAQAPARPAGAPAQRPQPYDRPDGTVDLARLEADIRSHPTTTAAPEPAAPVRNRSPFTPVMLFVALIAAGAMIPIAMLSEAHQPTQVVTASALAVVALGLLAGAWYGRGRGLVAAGTVLSLGLVATSVAGEVGNGGHLGDVDWRPVDASRTEQVYKVFIGTGTLDLTALPVTAGQRVKVRAEVSLGGLDVKLPRTAQVELHSRSRFGDITIDEQLTSGPNAKVDRVLPAENPPKGGPPVIELYLRSGLGDVAVNHV